jgi:FkbM family methyltransferase
VIDLGANHGEFSQRVRARFGCRCIAVEANPQLAHTLSAIPGVEYYRYALSDRDGASLTFHLSGQSEASSLFPIRNERNDHTVTVPSTTLQSLMNEAGVEHVDLLKVDIEGAEVQMFAATSDETLRQIDQITVEFHDFCGYVTAAQITQLRRRLDAAGFSGYRYDLDNKNWLFVRRSVASSLRRLYAGHLLSCARRALHRLRLAAGTRLVSLANE